MFCLILGHKLFKRRGLSQNVRAKARKPNKLFTEIGGGGACFAIHSLFAGQSDAFFAQNPAFWGRLHQIQCIPSSGTSSFLPQIGDLGKSALRGEFSPSAEGCSLCAVRCPLFPYLQPLIGLQIPFAPEPVFHRVSQPIEDNSMPNLQQSIAGRKRIVEDCIICEVAHGKVVDLADRARMARAGRIDPFHNDAPGKHGSTLNEPAASIR